MKRLSTTEFDIPTIDISPFSSGSGRDKRKVAGEVAEACQKIGFLVITGHGISENLLEKMFTKTFAFFDLPFEEKNYWSPKGPAKQRGYQRIESRNLASTIGQITPPDLRETVFLGPMDDHRTHFQNISAASNAYAVNIIPNQPPGVCEVFIEIYRTFETLAFKIMRILAVALDLPEGYFFPFIDKHFSVLGAHHYPMLETIPRKHQLRAGAHTDFGAVTILAMTNGRGGLEVQMSDGNWFGISPKKGELVVNLGDMMQRWTNDHWVSTPHRVVAPKVGDPLSRRLTLAYFLHPNFDADIQCIRKCIKDDENARYEPVTAGEHIRQKMEVSLSH